MSEQNYITIHQFAQAVKRFPNYIYLLTKKGNRFRKLKSKKLAGRLMIPTTEIDEFPFTAADKVLIEYKKRKRDEVNELKAKLKRYANDNNNKPE